MRGQQTTVDKMAAMEKLKDFYEWSVKVAGLFLRFLSCWLGCTYGWFRNSLQTILYIFGGLGGG